jgi:hypothetical protein
MFQTFTRTWWRRNPKWPNGLEPHAGRKTVYRVYETEQEARDACMAWGRLNPPGKLSRKMEYRRI